jgi:hypothetical protein
MKIFSIILLFVLLKNKANAFYIKGIIWNI